MSRIAVHDGLFDLDDDGGITLVGGSCVTCDRPHFPLLDTCPLCGATTVTLLRLSRTGTLWGWTAVTAAPPGYDGPVPFGFGVVELPEGLRVVTRLTEADPDVLTFGQPMAVVADVVATRPAEPGEGAERAETVDEVVAWAFAPTPDADPTRGREPNGGDEPNGGEVER